MRVLFNASVFLFIAIFSPAPVLAQVGLTAGSVYHEFMGFQPVAPLVGVDINSPAISNYAWWSPANKYVGNGWTAWEQGAYYLNRGAFGVGPAALVRYTSTSEWKKTSVYPSVAAQCRAGAWRVESYVHFRDQWTQNHGRGASLVVRRELPALSQRIGMAARAGITVLKFSDNLPFSYGTVMQFGVILHSGAVSR